MTTPTKIAANLSAVVHDTLVQQVRDNLTPDLLKPGYGGDNPVQGHCYVASEALYHLVGGARSGLKPKRMRMPDGAVHWWLEDAEGNVIDPTHDQYAEIPYEEGRGGGFLTREPSKRAQALIRKVKGEVISSYLPGQWIREARFALKPVKLGEQYFSYLGNLVRAAPEYNEQVLNLYDGDIHVGSIVFRPYAAYVYISELFVLPSYRKTNAFFELLKPVLETGMPIWADFDNPELERIVRRLAERGRIQVAPFQGWEHTSKVARFWHITTDPYFEIDPRKQGGVIHLTDDEGLTLWHPKLVWPRPREYAAEIEVTDPTQLAQTLSPDAREWQARSTAVKVKRVVPIDEALSVMAKVAMPYDTNVWYHLTYLDRLPSIAEHGLQPREFGIDQAWSTAPVAANAVYLWPSASMAYGYQDSQAYRNHTTMILRIQGIDQSRLAPDHESFLHILVDHEDYPDYIALIRQDIPDFDPSEDFTFERGSAEDAIALLELLSPEVRTALAREMSERSNEPVMYYGSIPPEDIDVAKVNVLEYESLYEDFEFDEPEPEDDQEREQWIERRDEALDQWLDQQGEWIDADALNHILEWGLSVEDTDDTALAPYMQLIPLPEYTYTLAPGFARRLAGFRILTADVMELAKRQLDNLRSREDIQKLYNQPEEPGPILRLFFNSAILAIDPTLMEEGPQGVAGLTPDSFKLWPWAIREMKKGNIDRNNFRHAIDIINQATHWLQWSKEYNRSTPDYMRRDFGFREMQAWVYEMSAQGLEDDPNRPQWQQEEVVYKFDDGWYIAKVGPDDAKLEGQLMGHCVGGYCEMIRSGNTYIYSLRDPKGQPHVTLEARSAFPTQQEIQEYHAWDRPWQAAHHKFIEIIQIQGKSDSEPIPEYKRYIANWFTELQDVNVEIEWARDSVQHHGEDFDDPDYEYEEPDVVLEVSSLEDILDTAERIEKEGIGSFQEDNYSGEYKYEDIPGTDDYGIGGARRSQEIVYMRNQVQLGEPAQGRANLLELWKQFVRRAGMGYYDPDILKEFVESFWVISLAAADQYWPQLPSAEEYLAEMVAIENESVGTRRKAPQEETLFDTTELQTDLNSTPGFQYIYAYMSALTKGYTVMVKPYRRDPETGEYGYAEEEEERNLRYDDLDDVRRNPPTINLPGAFAKTAGLTYAWAYDPETDHIYIDEDHPRLMANQLSLRLGYEPETIEEIMEGYYEGTDVERYYKLMDEVRDYVTATTIILGWYDEHGEPHPRSDTLDWTEWNDEEAVAPVVDKAVQRAKEEWGGPTDVQAPWYVGQDWFSQGLGSRLR